MCSQFLTCTLILSACLGASYAATSGPGTYGSSALAAGNPNLPTFTLSQAETDRLPPIPHEVYQDSLLPTVINYSTIKRFCFKTNCKMLIEYIIVCVIYFEIRVAITAIQTRLCN